MHPDFKLKDLTIQQHKAAMKIGTDALLLGAWAKNEGDKILDIGSGTGILSLMMAKRFDKSLITAVEINREAATEIKENIKLNKLDKCIEVVETDIISFAQSSKQTFDCIISNPPYFDLNRHHSSQVIARATARQSGSLSLSTLFKISNQLLKETGSINIVYPFQFKQQVLTEAIANGIFCAELFEVCHNKNEVPSIVMMHFKKYSVPINISRLNLKDGDNYSKDYQNLLSDFLL